MVTNEQLALYCRGNTASFSARIVSIDEHSGKSKVKVITIINPTCMRERVTVFCVSQSVSQCVCHAPDL